MKRAVKVTVMKYHNQTEGNSSFNNLAAFAFTEIQQQVCTESSNSDVVLIYIYNIWTYIWKYVKEQRVVGGVGWGSAAQRPDKLWIKLAFDPVLVQMFLRARVHGVRRKNM